MFQYLTSTKKILIILLLSLCVTVYILNSVEPEPSKQDIPVTHKRPILLQPKISNKRKHFTRQAPKPTKKKTRSERMDMKLRQYIDELKEHQTKAYHRYNYSTIYEPRIQGEQMAILVYTSCTLHAAATRNTIRQTWGSIDRQRPKSNIILAFVVGKSPADIHKTKENKDALNELKIEHQHHQDILMFDFIDSYRNLTLKSLNTLKWFIQTNMSLLVKCDSDVIVNWRTIYKLANEIKTKTSDFIIGHRMHTSPIRDQTSKWFVPYQVYNRTTYPDFASGGAYVISSSAVSKILQKYYSIRYLYLEDVFIAGLCRSAANITLIHSQQFLRDKEDGISDKWERIASVHGYSRRALINTWLAIEGA